MSIFLFWNKLSMWSCNHLIRMWRLWLLSGWQREEGSLSQISAAPPHCGSAVTSSMRCWQWASRNRTDCRGSSPSWTCSPLFRGWSGLCSPRQRCRMEEVEEESQTVHEGALNGAELSNHLSHPAPLQRGATEPLIKKWVRENISKKECCLFESDGR